MRALDEIAEFAGIRDEGLALRTQIVDQDAHARFIVLIGALERDDFAAHGGFELGCAGEHTLQPAVHCADFAPDGIAKRRDGGDAGAVRFGEADRDLRHRAGDSTHVLRALRERSHDEEEQDRRGDESDHHRALGHALRRGKVERRLADLRRNVDDAQSRPDGGRKERRDHRPGGRAALQAMQDMGERAGVVVRRPLLGPE